MAILGYFVFVLATISVTFVFVVGWILDSRTGDFTEDFVGLVFLLLTIAAWWGAYAWWPFEITMKVVL